MSNYMTYADATTILTEYADRIKALKGAYIVRGNSTFANLPAVLTATMNGFVYNVTDKFTTDTRFVEGTGKKYSANTNVVIVNLGDDETPDMKFDVISMFVDTEAITNDIQAVRDSIVGEFADDVAYSEGDIVTYEKKIYKFNTDHAAGAWDATEADEKTVVGLIKESEPEGLTSTQTQALIDLLD